MPAGWVWDESLYAGSSSYYDRGRVPYPQGLHDAFAAVTDLRGSPRRPCWWPGNRDALPRADIAACAATIR